MFDKETSFAARTLKLPSTSTVTLWDQSLGFPSRVSRWGCPLASHFPEALMLLLCLVTDELIRADRPNGLCLAYSRLAWLGLTWVCFTALCFA